GTGSYSSRVYYGSGKNGAPITTHGEFVTSIAALESIYAVTAGAGTYHYVVKTSYVPFPTDFVQHLVLNTAPDFISDMTTQCDLGGLFSYTVRSPLTTGSVYSSGNISAQSFLRFYNASTYDSPVTVALYDAAKGGGYLG